MKGWEKLKKIKREVTTTTVKVALVEANNGQLVSTEQEPITLVGNPNDKTLHNYLVDQFKEKQFVILSKVSQTQVYEMPVLDFIRFAEPVTKIS